MSVRVTRTAQANWQGDLVEGMENTLEARLGGD
jgi:hypothetical protein